MKKVTITIDIDPAKIKRSIITILQKRKILIFLPCILFITIFVYAEIFEPEYSFVNNDPVMAHELNENFQKLYDRVNLIAGNTENVSVGWIRSRIEDMKSENDLFMDDADERYEKTKNQDNRKISEDIILMWSKSISSIPSGWGMCKESRGGPPLEGKFIVGADREPGETPADIDPPLSPDINRTYYRSDESNRATHFHSMFISEGSTEGHHHSAYILESSGAHNHVWLRLYEYLPLSNIPEHPWLWETIYGNNSDTLHEIPFEYGVSFESPSSGTNYVPLAFSVTNRYLISGEGKSFLTRNNSGQHKHGIPDSPEYNGDTFVQGIGHADSTETGFAHNTPAHHALPFIIKE